MGGSILTECDILLHSRGVPGSGSWSAQAGSHTLTLAWAALLVKSSDARERGCPVRCRSQIRSVVEIQSFGPGAILCIAVLSA